MNMGSSGKQAKTSGERVIGAVTFIIAAVICLYLLVLLASRAWQATSSGVCASDQVATAAVLTDCSLVSSSPTTSAAAQAAVVTTRQNNQQLGYYLVSFGIVVVTVTVAMHVVPRFLRRGQNVRGSDAKRG